MRVRMGEASPRTTQLSAEYENWNQCPSRSGTRIFCAAKTVRRCSDAGNRRKGVALSRRNPGRYRPCTAMRAPLFRTWSCTGTPQKFSDFLRPRTHAALSEKRTRAQLKVMSEYGKAPARRPENASTHEGWDLRLQQDCNISPGRQGDNASAVLAKSCQVTCLLADV